MDGSKVLPVVFAMANSHKIFPRCWSFHDRHSNFALKKKKRKPKEKKTAQMNTVTKKKNFIDLNSSKKIVAVFS